MRSKQINKNQRSCPKIPKYSAPKQNCLGCKKDTNVISNASYKNRTISTMQLPRTENRQKEDAKVQRSTNHYEEKKTVKQQSVIKLFTIIQTFHNNLCSLPLNVLLNSEHPQQWLKQQYRTLGCLSAKLQLASKNIQTDYYCAKIQSVKLVLSNIEQNLQSLQNFAQTMNYMSSKSSKSQSAISSVTSSRINFNNKNMDWESLIAQSNSHCSVSDLESCRQQIMPFQRVKYNKDKQNIDTENMKTINNSKNGFSKAQHFKQMIKVEQQHRKQQTISFSKNNNKVFEESLYEIQEPNSTISMNSYDKIYDHNLLKYRQSVAELKYGSTALATLRSVQDNSQHRLLGLTCLKTYKSQPNQTQEQELSNLQERLKLVQDRKGNDRINEHKQQISSGLLTSKWGDKQNDCANTVSKQRKPIVSQKMKDDMAITDNNSTKIFQRQLMLSRQKYNSHIHILEKKINQLQVELTESQLQLCHKDKQIQKLLINHQQLESVIEIYKAQRNSSGQQHAYSLQRIQILEDTSKKLQKQVQQWKNRQRDLRSTIKHHQISNLQLQKTNQQLIAQIRQQIEQMVILRSEMGSLGQQVRSLKKNERVLMEQLQIYRRKYHKSVQQEQIRKMLCKHTYSGKNSKVQQLRELVAQHRQTFAEQQQMQQSYYSQQQQQYEQQPGTY